MINLHRLLRVSFARDEINATRKSDIYEHFALGRLRVRMFGVKVPARLVFFIMTWIENEKPIWLTREQLLGDVVREG